VESKEELNQNNVILYEEAFRSVESRPFLPLHHNINLM
jgi:hypothetical protein